MAYYDSNPANFATGRALTEDELRRAAPSIFATEAHDSRSDRFHAIPTIQVLKVLEKEGFHCVGARQSTSRDVSKKDFTKHLLRLRRLDNETAHSVGGTVCEVLLKNANDGTSAYELMAGLFRIQCLNSLVSQTSTLDSLKVRHTGDVAGKVIEGTWRVLGEAQKALKAPADWSAINMAPEARVILAEAAHVLRFGDADGETDTPIKPAQLLAIRRREDDRNDLWTTFNRVQENVIAGGLRARRPNELDERGRMQRGRAVTTRRVNGIDQDVKLNKALWTLTEKMAALLKSAA